MSIRLKLERDRKVRDSLLVPPGLRTCSQDRVRARPQQSLCGHKHTHGGDRAERTGKHLIHLVLGDG